MRKFSLKSKKGVSPIIATLLLIVIAVAAGVVVYSFVMGFIGGVSTGQSGQAQFVVDTYSVNTNGTIAVYIRNIGTKNVGPQTVYLNGAPANTDDVKINGSAFSSTAWPVGSVTTFLLNNTSVLRTGANTVKIVFADATPFEFTVVKS
ncbi:MAG: archaellin/type IV pilin N-terminal domain-containing protein [Anaerolineae bacterium]